MQKSRARAHLKLCLACKAAPRAPLAKKYCGTCGPRVRAEIAAESARRRADCYRRRANEYYRANRETVLAKHRSEEGRAKSRERMRKKLKDPAFRLHSNMSRAVRAAMKGAKDGKPWESVLGFTRRELISHLERQFVKGMVWGNMGEWEIDHILPRSMFDMSDPAQFKQCWALSNLRPLWKAKNREKSAKREHLL